MKLHTILCEICDEPIARAQLSKLARPLTGDMFESLGEGYDNPFWGNVPWEWMRCPMCRYRPFVVTEEQGQRASANEWDGPEVVKTSKGPYRIGDKAYPGMPQQHRL